MSTNLDLVVLYHPDGLYLRGIATGGYALYTRNRQRAKVVSRGYAYTLIRKYLLDVWTIVAVADMSGAESKPPHPVSALP